MLVLRCCLCFNGMGSLAVDLGVVGKVTGEFAQEGP